MPALAQYFIQRSAETSGMPARELSADALAALQAYDWPGNVRQLRNLMDWLLIMAPGGAAEPIRADMLPPEIGSNAPALLNDRSDGRHHGPAACARRGTCSRRSISRPNCCASAAISAAPRSSSAWSAARCIGS